MTLILAFAAGLLTLINPCVLPVLPLVLAASLQASRLGPLALAAGLSAAFVTVGLTLGLAGAALGLTDEAVAQAGALALTGFGLLLVIPAATRGLAFATTGIGSRAARGIDRIGPGGAGRQFLGQEDGSRRQLAKGESQQSSPKGQIDRLAHGIPFRRTK